MLIWSSEGFLHYEGHQVSSNVSEERRNKFSNLEHSFENRFTSITPIKAHPTKGYEGPEREQKYRFILSLISTLVGCGWATPRPGRSTPGKRPGSHCAGGCVGPRAGLDGVHKPRPPPIGMQSPDRPGRSEPTGIPVINEIQRRKTECVHESWREQQDAWQSRLVPSPLIRSCCLCTHNFAYLNRSYSSVSVKSRYIVLNRLHHRYI